MSVAKILKLNIVKILFLPTLAWLYACAQLGSPSGGKKDETAPVLLNVLPKNLSTNIPTNTKKIRFEFDEFVKLDKSKKLIISPSLQTNPTIYPVSTPKKHIELVFNDELEKETTYQINFGKSISDLNEGNAYPNFSYVFSTGNYLDSLEINGKLKSIREKDFSQAVVALYPDSLDFDNPRFFYQNPKYIGSVDSLGDYKINYLGPGRYRLMAYWDENKNFVFDADNEMVGFFSDAIKLKENIDSIHLQMFFPEPIYKVISASQSGYGRIGLKINGMPKDLKIDFLGNKIKDYQIEKLEDSLSIWFDPKKQSFAEEKSTSMQLVLQSKEQLDTLKLTYYKQKAPELFLEAKDYDRSILSDYKISANQPIHFINQDSVQIFLDSLPIDFTTKLDENKKNLHLVFDKKWGKRYKICLQPSAITDIFENKNDSLSFYASTDLQQNYGTLDLEWETESDLPFFIELTKENEHIPYKSIYITNEKKHFYNNMPPGNYQVVIKFDENQDGLWKSGNIKELRQAEKQIILPKKIEIRALWEVKQKIVF